MFTHTIGPDSQLALFERYHAQSLYLVVEANREYLRAWLPWADVCDSVGHTLSFIERGLEQFAAGNGYQAGLWHQGQLVGSVGTHAINWAHRYVSLGYWLSEQAEGQGLMTRAVDAVVSHLFDVVRLHRVEIRCASGNRRSRAIPERLGFTQDGVLRGAEKIGPRYHDLVVYGILRAEWRQRDPR